MATITFVEVAAPSHKVEYGPATRCKGRLERHHAVRNCTYYDIIADSRSSNVVPAVRHPVTVLSDFDSQRVAGQRLRLRD